MLQEKRLNHIFSLSFYPPQTINRKNRTRRASFTAPRGASLQDVTVLLHPHSKSKKKEKVVPFYLILFPNTSSFHIIRYHIFVSLASVTYCVTSSFLIFVASSFATSHDTSLQFSNKKNLIVPSFKTNILLWYLSLPLL